MTRARWVVLVVCLPCLAGSVTSIPAVESGFRQMYNLDFDEAHKTFGLWERTIPAIRWAWCPTRPPTCLRNSTV
jgi:hypothetical protein